MHPTLRTVALTAALAALAPAAFADPVIRTLNFDDLGAQAETLEQPVDVGVRQGLRFTGAYGYGTGMLDSNDEVEASLAMVSLPNSTFPNIPDRHGFLLNKQRGLGQSGTDIIITLAASASTGNAVPGPAVFFQAITFNLFINGTGTNNWMYATGVDDSGGPDTGQPRRYDDPIGSGGMDIWSTVPLSFVFRPSQQITSLRLTAGGAAFALDDMVVTLSAATDPSDVPEPASYGLVGLALLGAGAASRRKQRG